MRRVMQRRRKRIWQQLVLALLWWFTAPAFAFQHRWDGWHGAEWLSAGATTTTSTSTTTTTSTSSTTTTSVFGLSYFVKTAGNDAADGLTDSTAWKTFAGKVNGFAFAAGDVVHLNRGDTWAEQLAPTANGTAAHPVEFTNYGSGAKPVITTNISAQGAFQNAARNWVTVNGLDLRGGVNGYGARTFGNNITVAGFTVISCALSGNHGFLAAATGTGVHNLMVVSNNDVTPTSTGLTHSGIEFTGADNHPGRLYTNFTIANNVINPAGEDGIVVEDAATGTISGNYGGGDGENCIDVKDSSAVVIDSNSCDTDQEYNIVVHEDEAETVPNNLTFGCTVSNNTLRRGGQNGFNQECIFLDYASDTVLTPSNTFIECFGADVLSSH